MVGAFAKTSPAAPAPMMPIVPAAVVPMMMQTPPTHPRVIHLWVDPVFGVDATANSNNPNGSGECPPQTPNKPHDFADPSQGNNAFLLHASYPFKTIAAAVAYVPPLPTVKSPATNVIWERAIIHLMPGVYRETTGNYLTNHEPVNGESYPIKLPDHVSIQGTSALNTLLVLEGHSSWGWGSKGPAFEFGSTSTTTGKNSFIDSVSILGAWREDGPFNATPWLGAAIYLNPQHKSSPTITNCFFFSNEIGVLVDAPLGPNSWHTPTIFNNTFVWNDVGVWNGQIAAINNEEEDSVGISELILVNNIFDATPPATTQCKTYPLASDFVYLGKSDFEGVDHRDMQIASPGAGNYNAFEGPVGLTAGKFDYGTQLVPGLPPTFARISNPTVAASRDISPFTGHGVSGAKRGILYIRDLLCNAPTSIFPPWSQTGFDRSPFDFRLSPAVTNATTGSSHIVPGTGGSLNPLVDNGWYHIWNSTMMMTGSSRTMSKAPGHLPLSSDQDTWLFDSWDYDAEGFGNPRSNDHPVYANNGWTTPQDPLPLSFPWIDIGADELGELSGIGYRAGTTNLMAFKDMTPGVSYPQMDNRYLWYLGPPTNLAGVGAPPQKDKPMFRHTTNVGVPPAIGVPWVRRPWWGTWAHHAPTYYFPSLADTTPHLMPDLHPWWKGLMATTGTNPIWRRCTWPAFYNTLLFQNPTAGVTNPNGTFQGYSGQHGDFAILDGYLAGIQGEGFAYLGQIPLLGGPINSPTWANKTAFSTFDLWCRANDAQTPTPGVRETFPPTFDPNRSGGGDPITALRFSLEVEGASTWSDPSPTNPIPLIHSNIQTFLVVIEK